MTTDVINIPNPDNNLFELNQVYTVRLVSSSILGVLPVGSVGDPITYTVTDDSNDLPDITLDYGGATTVTEGGNINVIIRIANAPDTGLGDNLYVKLALNTMDSTAEVADITVPSVGIQIPSGQRSSGNVEILAINDGMFDPGEVFKLLVDSVWHGGDSNDPASGTPVTLGKFVTGGTIRVVDKNAPMVTLTRVASGDVTEGDVGQKFERFEITLAEAVPVDLILDVDFGGTATPGTDFGASPTVTIPAMQMSVAYTVTVTADTDAEFDETVELSISGGTTSDGDMFTLDAIQNAEFTITNDDMVMVTLTGPASAIERVHRHADRYYAGVDRCRQVQVCHPTLGRPLPPVQTLRISQRKMVWRRLMTVEVEHNR